MGAGEIEDVVRAAEVELQADRGVGQPGCRGVAIDGDDAMTGLDGSADERSLKRSGSEDQ
jgi:hypothetical protein